MCGIAGLLGKDPLDNARTALSRLLSAIGHRGPDGSATWISTDQRLALGHVRLSIIDLSSAAAQPMRSPRGHVLTYNGEIYNYLELRKELGEERFKTKSDTEVILLAYERWGERCV